MAAELLEASIASFACLSFESIPPMRILASKIAFQAASILARIQIMLGKAW
jgi:hypothetical protein